MIKFPALLISFIFFFMSLNTTGLREVRSSYNKLASNKALCEKFIDEFTKTKNNSATHLAYLGALQTIWANHVFSPINKYSTFIEGKKNIEKAIKNQPENVEIRFIRLSVQKNAPSFLGYNSNIHEDTKFIKENSDQIDSGVLLNNIRTILK